MASGWRIRIMVLFEVFIQILGLRLSMISPRPIIIGAGPTGLATAIMLAKRGYSNIQVFDKLSQPPSPDDISVWCSSEGERNYNIGLSGRGQKAMQALGVLDKVRLYAAEVVGRKEWTPRSPHEPVVSFYTGRTYPSRILQRDRLTSVLFDEIEKKYHDRIKIHFNVVCINAQWKHQNSENELCQLTLKDVSTKSPLIFYEESDFVIGADGTQSAVREAIDKSKAKKSFSIKRFHDTNVRVYKTIPLHFPPNDPNFRKDLNYSVRLKAGYNLEALPTKEGLYLGVFIFRPDDMTVASITTGTQAKTFLESYFPMYKGCFLDSDLEAFAKKNYSYFPKFTFSGPNLHHGRTVALLGDCIHSVKPFFALGVNSAFEDVIYLNNSLSRANDNVPLALADYSASHGKDAKAMVEIAKNLDGGFLSFIFPLILDSIFHKALPFVFSPNILQSLNNENRSFRQIQLRKRFDRLVQICVGGAFVWVFRFFMKRVALSVPGTLVWV